MFEKVLRIRSQKAPNGSKFQLHVFKTTDGVRQTVSLFSKPFSPGKRLICNGPVLKVWAISTGESSLAIPAFETMLESHSCGTLSSVRVSFVSGPTCRRKSAQSQGFVPHFNSFAYLVGCALVEIILAAHGSQPASGIGDSRPAAPGCGNGRNVQSSSAPPSPTHYLYRATSSYLSCRHNRSTECCLYNVLFLPGGWRSVASPTRP